RYLCGHLVSDHFPMPARNPPRSVRCQLHRYVSAVCCVFTHHLSCSQLNRFDEHTLGASVGSNFYVCDMQMNPIGETQLGPHAQKMGRYLIGTDKMQMVVFPV